MQQLNKKSFTSCETFPWGIFVELPDLLVIMFQASGSIHLTMATLVNVYLNHYVFIFSIYEFLYTGFLFYTVLLVSERALLAREN